MPRTWVRHQSSQVFRIFRRTSDLGHLHYLPIRTEQRRMLKPTFRILQNTKSTPVKLNRRHFYLERAIGFNGRQRATKWVGLYRLDFAFWASIRKCRSLAGRMFANIYCRPPICGKMHLILCWSFWNRGSSLIGGLAVAQIWPETHSIDMYSNAHCGNNGRTLNLNVPHSVFLKSTSRAFRKIDGSFVWKQFASKLNPHFTTFSIVYRMASCGY